MLQNQCLNKMLLFCPETSSSQQATHYWDSYTLLEWDELLAVSFYFDNDI